MKNLNAKPQVETARFESDDDVVRTVRLQKFVVGRAPLQQFAQSGSNQTVYPIACSPAWDLRTQVMMFERALINLGFTTKDIRKNVMTVGLAPRFIVAVNQQGLVLHYLDKGLLIIDMSMTALEDKWTP